MIMLENIMVMNDGKFEKIILQCKDGSEVFEIVLSRKFDTFETWVAKSKKPISQDVIKYLLNQFSAAVKILG